MPQIRQAGRLLSGNAPEQSAFWDQAGPRTELPDVFSAVVLRLLQTFQWHRILEFSDALSAVLALRDDIRVLCQPAESGQGLCGVLEAAGRAGETSAALLRCGNKIFDLREQRLITKTDIVPGWSFAVAPLALYYELYKPDGTREPEDSG